jgi:hypothetical protein
LSSILYIIGIQKTVLFIIYLILFIKQYIIYFLILLLIICLLLVFNFTFNLYVLHKFYVAFQKNEKIIIPKTLPDFVIKKLEDLEMISKNEVLLKEYK